MWNGLLFVHPSFEGSADKPRRKADWILFHPQIWPLPGRVRMLHSQCFNTFLRIWCFPEQIQTPGDEVGRTDPSLCYCLLYFKCKHEWRDSPDSTQPYLPQEQVMLLLYDIALVVVFQTQPCHQFFHSRQNQFTFSTGQLLITVMNLYFLGFLGQISNSWDQVILCTNVSAEYCCG